MLSTPSNTFSPLPGLPASIFAALIVRDGENKRLVGRQKRDAEHADGRQAAANALRQLNRTEAVGKLDNGCPAWPDGIVGSISHTSNYAWAVVGQALEFRSIGIDTEPLCESQTVDNLREQIAGGTEWRLAQDAGLSPTEAFTVVFSAKESLYKCVYPLSPVFFEFKDACLVEIGSGKLTLRVNDDCPNRLMRGVEMDVSYAVSPTDAFTACWMQKGEKHER